MDGEAVVLGEALSCFIVEGHDTRTGGVWLVSRLVLTLPLPQRRLRRNGWRTGTPGGTTVGWQLAGMDTGVPASAVAPLMPPAYAPASQSVESATVRALLQVCEPRRLRQPSYVSVVV